MKARDKYEKAIAELKGDPKEEEIKDHLWRTESEASCNIEEPYE